MQRTISSAQTFFMKFIFPVIWISIFGLGTLGQFTGALNSGDTAPPETKWMFLSMWVLGSAFIYWSAMRLKRVSMTDNALFISNYQKEIRVPFQDIQSVSENRWINIHPITIKFRHPTDFGDRIVFMPTVRWFAFWSSHPIVAELRDAARRASGGDPSQSAL